MKKTIYKRILICFIAALGACEITELDLLDNPNSVSPDNANIDLLLNGAMNNFRTFTRRQSDRPMQLVRMTHMFGPTYDNGFVPETFDNLWNGAYAGVLPDLEFVITKGAELGFYNHTGIAKILKSYTLTTLVDLFGDVPYTEAIQLTENLNPSVDDGKAIYATALNLLNEAIADFDLEEKGDVDKNNDVFYQANISKWTKLANTLKLRIYNNTRLVDAATAKTEINKLIMADNLITSASGDFEVNYGTQDNDPDVRHYKFTAGYLGNGGEYMASYLMNLMYNTKDAPDPRMKYYFYRQSLTYPDPSTPEGLFTLPCLAEDKPLHYSFSDPFCKIGDGYWGRDHMNNDGGPPDGDKITLWGLYPAGGKYDNGEGTPGKKSDGAKGTGINPLWDSAATYFVLAEAAHEVGSDGDPKTYLEKAIKASFAKVREFNSSSIPSNATVPTDDQVAAYITEVLESYDTATSVGQMNIIMTESFIASWGNGLEPYNGYRRTGFPDNLQPPVTSTPGAFLRSMPYPANSVSRNQNIDTKPNNEVQVFWDNNAPNFIN